MLRKILIGLAIVIFIFLLGIAWATYYFYPSAERVLSFIENKPHKSAICMQHNGKVIVSQNADTIMPLASTVKIIVAIEFANQFVYGQIDTAEMIDTSLLDRYYIPDTDGGAHEKWLSELRNNQSIKNGKVNLMQVAKGMMHYSSNANTEFLMDKLGFANINARLDSLGLIGHQPLYPFVSALFVCQNTSKKDYKTFLNELRSMTPSQYRSACYAIHEKLKHDSTFKKTFNPLDTDKKVQEIWSMRLPGGNCNMYVSLMQRLNSKEYFTPLFYSIISPLMERLMQNEKNHTWLKHAGKKGGSTATVLTEAMYATDKQNNKTEIAVMFNNLSQMENLKLQFSLNEFDLKLISDSSFRQQVVKTLNKK